MLANATLLVFVIGFVVKSPSAGQSLKPSISTLTDQSGAISAPRDQISSADIAVHVARMTRLFEATSVVNNADSVNAKLAYTSSSSAIVPKPQLMNVDGLKSIKDLSQYTTRSGDTVSSLADKFGITSDSIRWSNNIAGNTLGAGVTLWIPPVDGIVYVVQNGDTVASLASTYKTSKDVIIVFNDIEISGLRPGSRIVIPGGKKVAAAVAVDYAPSLTLLGSGGYDYGWCTYYAAARAGVPGGWGNANTWHLYAPLSGWTVSSVPKVGAVAQSTVGWAGHVGIVEAVRIVSGQYEIKYSDMNGLAGFNRVGYSGWEPAHQKFQNFIYP